MKTGNISIILCMLIDSVLAFGAGSRGSMPVWLHLLNTSVVVLGATMFYFHFRGYLSGLT